MAKEQLLQEQMNSVLAEKNSLEKEASQRVASEKETAERLVEQFKTKMVSCEESEREMQRRVMSSESEFEKQKALLEQKIEFLETTLKQSQEKEKQTA